MPLIYVSTPSTGTRGFLIAIVLRRTSTCLAALVLAVLGVAVGASAAPTITSFKITPIPIPGFPGTGNILGAGAVIRGHLAVAGTEYGGSPPPLTGLKFYAPVGAKLHPQGFATCAPSVIEKSGPEACPKRSIAGPKGSAVGVVSFGSERVHETASVQPFFAPGGGLKAFVDGKTPAIIEILTSAHVLSAAPPFGVAFIGEIPLIETVPGALYASFEEGTVEVGAAYKQGKKTISYIAMPKRCPKGGLPVKVELSFFGGASAQASYKMPCPRK
jgi:hypothetical protein